MTELGPLTAELKAFLEPQPWQGHAVPRGIAHRKVAHVHTAVQWEPFLILAGEWFK